MMGYKTGYLEEYKKPTLGLGGLFTAIRQSIQVGLIMLSANCVPYKMPYILAPAPGLPAFLQEVRWFR